ncbi:MAG: LysR family transcriptional regulator [Chlamydiae bacterium]|nr:LysR family transcriptional regulator [Chlamydiota bacterium]
MDTDLLKTFLKISEIKNFTKASVILGRTQATISMQIAKLEILLGNKLFIRDNRNVSLSSFGELLVPYAEKMLQIEKELLSQFILPKVKGKIRFGTPEDIAFSYLPSILSDFTQTYKDIELEVKCDFTERLIEGIGSNEFDLILIKQDPHSPFPGSEQIWSEPLVWVAAKNSKFIKQMPAEELPLVLSPTPCVFRKRALQALSQGKISYRIVFSSASLAGNLSAVRAGLGISVLPKDLIGPEFTPLTYLPELQQAQIALIKKDSSPIIDIALHFISEKISSLHLEREKKKWQL